MNIFKRFWNWLIGENIYNTCSILNKEKLYFLEDESGPYSQSEVDEINQYIKLESQKYKAIQACDGCEEQVFVLKVNGIEIGYYSTLGKLAKANNLKRQSVYTYWNRINKSNKSKKFKGIYEIINYK